MLNPPVAFRPLRGALLAAAAAAAVTFLSAGAAAKRYVDLELVMATDVSRSIDEDEARLQRQGTADAFRSPEVINAILSGVLRRIAVAYIDYSSRDFNRLVVDWRIISDEKSAHAFSAELLAAPPTWGRRTSISDGIRSAVELIESNDIEGTRRVIDVAGDGPNNWGRLVHLVRDETIAKGITINGLPIMDPGGGVGSRFNIRDLDEYYRGCVIGGPGAFIVVARSFPDFARAVRRKLVLEIAGLPPPPRRNPLLIRVAETDRPMIVPSPTGFTYPRGCDIGERLRRGYWSDPDDN